MSAPTADLPIPPSPANATPAQLLFNDVPQELAATRRVLERVPDGHHEWQPHPKSMALGRLANHVAELPNFVTTILGSDELDWAKSEYKPSTVTTTAERLAAFDNCAAAMQTALDGVDWPALAKRWTMRAGDQVILDGQKGVLIRTVCISHIVHHRAQLGVYLRLLGAVVPGTYGPSADET
jgi:uncharacterized damage-inducible protein DinB